MMGERKHWCGVESERKGREREEKGKRREKKIVGGG